MTTDEIAAVAEIVAAKIAAEMAVAGRVAVVPKGEYNQERVYERLDMVRDKNKTYVAKKDNTGILPTNEEYWMLSMTNEVPAEEVVMFLPAGETSLEFVFNEIKTNSVITVQTNTPTVSYTDLQVSGNTVTAIFEPQETGIYIQMAVSDRPVASESYTVTETKVLAAGATELTFTSDSLKPNSTVNIQTDNPKAYYTRLTVSGNVLTVFFDALETNINVRAVISNESV